jgi:predicted O-linked N-acetylglucosamine transferase (SPINDLY family)
MIADRVVVPDAQRAHYSESMIYLPGSYQVNDNCRPIADAGFTRAQMGLPENAFVFACFNNPYKITPEEFDIWMRLLKAVEGSVLWLYKANPWAEANLRKEAKSAALRPAGSSLPKVSRSNSIWRVSISPICFSIRSTSTRIPQPATRYGADFRS